MDACDINRGGARKAAGRQLLPIIPELFSIPGSTYYSQNYSGIISASLAAKNPRPAVLSWVQPIPSRCSSRLSCHRDFSRNPSNFSSRLCCHRDFSPTPSRCSSRLCCRRDFSPTPSRCSSRLSCHGDFSPTPLVLQL